MEEWQDVGVCRVEDSSIIKSKSPLALSLELWGLVSASLLVRVKNIDWRPTLANGALPISVLTVELRSQPNALRRVSVFPDSRTAQRGAARLFARKRGESRSRRTRSAGFGRTAPRARAGALPDSAGRACRSAYSVVLRARPAGRRPLSRRARFTAPAASSSLPWGTSSMPSAPASAAPSPP